MLTKHKSQPLQIILLIIALSILYSCSESRSSGGPCEFQSFPGSAQFTELKPVTNGNEVPFDFIVSDPTVSVKYLNNNGKNLQLSVFDGDVKHYVFTNDWLNTNGISVGATVPAQYEELRQGSCAPGFVSFPTITGAQGG
jgi:hypothetical protein